MYCNRNPLAPNVSNESIQGQLHPITTHITFATMHNDLFFS